LPFEGLRIASTAKFPCREQGRGTEARRDHQQLQAIAQNLPARASTGAAAVGNVKNTGSELIEPIGARSEVDRTDRRED
jgi:hypothetical protein